MTQGDAATGQITPKGKSKRLWRVQRLLSTGPAHLSEVDLSLQTYAPGASTPLDLA